MGERGTETRNDQQARHVCDNCDGGPEIDSSSSNAGTGLAGEKVIDVELLQWMITVMMIL